jgi:hypothetical protein
LSQSIPIPEGANIAQYDHIQCVRPTDGLVLRAQRVIVNEQTPVSWTIVVEGKSEQWRDLGWTMDGTRETYSTSELIKFAKNAGFGEWQQSALDVREGTSLWEGEERTVLMPQYQIPDSTKYPKETEWVDIVHLHNKGLSDSTIAKLVQEDASFRRVNGNVIEYNVSNVYGHPKVQAFMNKLGSSVATAINYDNILNG